jgi:predicted TIM-barrel fold metal-dependent hydrolase
MYEPLWAAAQDLDMPLGLHIATNRPGPGQDFALEDRNCVRHSFLANADHWVRMSLADMIFSGVFEHYPKLQVGTVEQCATRRGVGMTDSPRPVLRRP